MSSSLPSSIDVATLREWRDSGVALTVLDVREPWELEICSIAGSMAIPLAQIPARHEEVPADRPVVITCHHGMRSAQAAAWLRRAGHDNVTNLDGGIDDWARKIDTGMATY